MRVLILLLSTSPLLINGDGGRGSSSQESNENGHNGACRSCPLPITPSEDACPPKGYECNASWPIKANGGTHHHRRCSEAKCAGDAKLAVDGEIVHSKLRCNKKQWTVNGEVPGNVVCAKSCDKRKCGSCFPRSLPNLDPLNVTDSSDTNACAIGTCEAPRFLVSLKKDGSIDTPLTGQTQVSCSGNGFWKGADESYKFVMCYDSPCDSRKCPALVPGKETAELQRLIIQNNELNCATATCPTGTKFVSMDAAGTVLNTITTDQLTCTGDGTWIARGDGGLYEFVMCQQEGPPACANNCNEVPFETNALTADQSPTQLNAAVRTGCSYTCPEGQSMFRRIESGNFNPVSVPMPAQCGTNSKFLAGNEYVTQIGCWQCDIPDGPLLSSPSATKPIVTNCIVTCPAGSSLWFLDSDDSETQGLGHIRTTLAFENGQVIGLWYSEFDDRSWNKATSRITCEHF